MEICHHSTIDFSSDEALEAADDVSLGESFRGPLGDVVLGRLMVLHPNNCGAVESGIGLAMSVPRKTMTSGHARRCRYGSDAAQFGECRLGVNAVGIVAKDDEYLRGGVRSDAEAIAQGRRQRGGEFGDNRVVIFHLSVQELPPTSQGAQCVLGRRDRIVDGSRSKTRTLLDECLVAEGIELLFQFLWRVHNHRLQRNNRTGAVFASNIAGHLDLSDHLDRAVSAFGNGRGGAGDDAACGEFSIERVAIAVSSTSSAVATIHFNDLSPLASEVTREVGSVAAGAFNAVGEDASKGLGPAVELLVAERVDRDSEVTESLSVIIENNCDMDVFVGVDTDNDLAQWPWW